VHRRFGTIANEAKHHGRPCAILENFDYNVVVDIYNVGGCIKWQPRAAVAADTGIVVVQV